LRGEGGSDSYCDYAEKCNLTAHILICSFRWHTLQF
jgi:hypothetical protein